MMGKAHSLTGVAAGLSGAAAYGLPPLESAFLAVLCGGAAVLPDIDHPDSTVSRTFGPLTWVFSEAVRRVSGGHRNGTHSAFGCALFSLAAFAALALHTGNLNQMIGGLLCAGVLLATGALTRLFAGENGQRCYKTEIGAILAVAFMLALAVGAVVAAMTFGRIVGTVALALLMILVLSALARALRCPGVWDDLAPFLLLWPQPGMDHYTPLFLMFDLTYVPWALSVGAAVHCMGDAITRGGVPWGWPFTQVNVGPKLIDTNGFTERRIITPLTALAIAATAAYLVSLGAGLAVGVGLALLLSAGKSSPRKSQKKKTTTRKRAKSRR